MTRYDRRVQALAVCLSGLAGYVDAIGFLELRGFFVSFMSGNSTRLGVGLARWSPQALVAAGLVGSFVVGVVVGSLIGHAAKHRRRPAVLALVAVLLAIAAGLGIVGVRTGAIVATGLAMGAENAVFERDGEIHIGLTYMTGTLVKFGQRIAYALLGGDRLAWLPYFSMWLGLVVGATTGALVYPRLGLTSLGLAAGGAMVLAVAARFIDPGQSRRQASTDATGRRAE